MALNNNLPLSEETRVLWNARQGVAEVQRGDTLSLEGEALPWLTQGDAETERTGTAYRTESLRAALLKDIARYLQGQPQAQPQPAASSGWLKWLKRFGFAAVTLSGLALAIAEGSEIVTGIAGGLGLVAGFSAPVLAASLTLGVGLAFAFWIAEFREVAEQLGFEISSNLFALPGTIDRVKRWVDVYAEQTRQIEAVKKFLLEAGGGQDKTDLADLQKRRAIAIMLAHRHDALAAIRAQLDEDGTRFWFVLGKVVGHLVISAAFFGAGCNIGLSVLSLFAASPPLWLGLVVAVSFGAVAVGVYWGFNWLEGEGIMGSLFGMDKKNVNTIRDGVGNINGLQTTIEQELAIGLTIQQQNTQIADQTTQIAERTAQIAALQAELQALQPQPVTAPSTSCETPVTPLLAPGSYGFFRQTSSVPLYPSPLPESTSLTASSQRGQ